MDENGGVNFGMRIREIRKKSGLTLETLADESGVSRAALSKIERCEQSPGLEVAVRIADALGTNLAQILSATEPQRIDVPRGPQPSVIDRFTGVRRESLFPTLAGVEVVRFTFPPHTTAGPFSPHGMGSQEVFVVLEGRISVGAENGDLHLSKHDIASISGNQEHLLRNTGDEEATFIIFITRP